MMILGITGRAGSGKSSASAYLETYHRFHKTAFADPVKKTVSELFKIPIGYLQDPEEKSKLDPIWKKTRREIMQVFATECMRDHFGADFWTKLMLLSIMDLRYQRGDNIDIVIDDVRFPEEVQMIRDLGGCIILIRRPNNPHEIDQSHVSESLTGVDPDRIVVNSGSLTELYVYTKAACTSLYNMNNTKGN